MVTVRSPVDVNHTSDVARDLGPMLGVGDPSPDGSGLVERVLALARIHLGPDVSWFSRFVDGKQILDHIAAFFARPAPLAEAFGTTSVASSGRHGS